MTIVAQGTNALVAEPDADANGEFRTELPATGAFVIHGQVPGYLAVCASPSAALPGLPFEVAGEDLVVDIPVYPIHAEILTIENRTNLSDEVFQAIVTVRQTYRGGIDCPPAIVSVTQKRLFEAAVALGYRHVVVCLRTAFDATSIPKLQAAVMVRGRVVSSLESEMQPLSDLLDRPVARSLRVDDHWQVAAVIFDTLAPLRLSSVESSFAGGMEVPAGSTQWFLPHGEYTLAPSAANSLLKERDWTRRINVPSDATVTVRPESGFAQLILEKSDAWLDGALHVAGVTGSFSAWRDAEFPMAVHATPGDITLSILVPRVDGSHAVSWSQRVKLVDRATTTVRVGER
ncbi:MAG: hypothetical protein AB7I19_11180 [Planctomycetota bacterium]